jgi:uncharacterized spore protein YtfJ
MSVESLLAKASEGIHATRSFGPVIEGDGCLLVPVAITGGGGGGGDGASEHGPGAGGGFGTVSWPLGVYVIKDGNVRWVPAFDLTRLALGALAVLRAVVRLRSRRS